jgi:hypothetical protein
MSEKMTEKQGAYLDSLKAKAEPSTLVLYRLWYRGEDDYSTLTTKEASDRIAWLSGATKTAAPYEIFKGDALNIWKEHRWALDWDRKVFATMRERYDNAEKQLRAIGAWK